MFKARIAEWILSLLTTRERAASMAGDLMERASAGGAALRFWGRLVQTIASLLWKDLAAEPRFLAGLAFRGLLVNLGYWMLFGVACFVVVLAALAVAIANGFDPSTENLPDPGIWTMRALYAAAVIATVAVQFPTGRWIARRSRGREVAACAVFIVLGEIFMLLLSVGIPVGHRLHSAGGIDPISLAAFLAAAVRVRCQSARRADA